MAKMPITPATRSKTAVRPAAQDKMPITPAARDNLVYGERNNVIGKRVMNDRGGFSVQPVKAPVPERAYQPPRPLGVAAPAAAPAKPLGKPVSTVSRPVSTVAMKKGGKATKKGKK